MSNSDQFYKMRSLERGGYDAYELDDFRDLEANVVPEDRAFVDIYEFPREDAEQEEKGID